MLSVRWVVLRFILSPRHTSLERNSSPNTETAKCLPVGFSMYKPLNVHPFAVIFNLNSLSLKSEASPACRILPAAIIV